MRSSWTWLGVVCFALVVSSVSTPAYAQIEINLDVLDEVEEPVPLVVGTEDLRPMPSANVPVVEAVEARMEEAMSKPLTPRVLKPSFPKPDYKRERSYKPYKYIPKHYLKPGYEKSYEKGYRRYASPDREMPAYATMHKEDVTPRPVLQKVEPEVEVVTTTPAVPEKYQKAPSPAETYRDYLERKEDMPQVETAKVAPVEEQKVEERVTFRPSGRVATPAPAPAPETKQAFKPAPVEVDDLTAPVVANNTGNEIQDLTETVDDGEWIKAKISDSFKPAQVAETVPAIPRKMARADVEEITAAGSIEASAPAPAPVVEDVRKPVAMAQKVEKPKSSLIEEAMSSNPYAQQAVSSVGGRATATVTRQPETMAKVMFPSRTGERLSAAPSSAAEEITAPTLAPAPVEPSRPRVIPMPPAPTPSPAVEQQMAMASVPVPPVPSEPVAEPNESTLATVSFKLNSSDITAEGKQMLDQLVAMLNEIPDQRVQIRAYAEEGDETQSDARRMSLSRGLMVRSYLKDKGIKPVRLDIRALGNETDPPRDRVDVVLVE